MSSSDSEILLAFEKWCMDEMHVARHDLLSSTIVSGWWLAYKAATLAERKRCADVARSYKESGPLNHPSFSIALAIEKGDK